MARTATKPTTATEKHPDEVHHMVRALAAEPGNGQFTGDQLDAHCQTWLKQGYTLQSVHPTYVRPEQGPGGMIVTTPRWDILYMFVARTGERPTTAHPDGPAVHHMVRALAAEPGNGQFTGDQLDAHCQTWLEQGYTLHSVHPTYVRPEQGPGGMIVTAPRWDILYMFVRE